jgi:hypothetical protein
MAVSLPKGRPASNKQTRVVRSYVAVAALVVAGLLVPAAGAEAQQEASPPSSVRQSLDDAWWTGPMLAPSAATLPRGHFLIEGIVPPTVEFG